MKILEKILWLIWIILVVFFFIGAGQKITSLETQIMKQTERLEGCKEFSLFKQATLKIQKGIYDLKNYNCVDFSKDLVRELEEMGIKSSVAIDKNRTHAWVLVWIEPQSGNFISPEEALEIIEIRDGDMKIIIE